MFTIPIFDDNPPGAPSLINWLIIGLCVLAFLWQESLDADQAEAVAFALGMVPAVLSGSAQLSDDIRLVPAGLTLLTSMFLHGGWLHLIGNMLYLWIFGDNVEDSMGHGRYLAFYLLCGLAAALAQYWADPGSRVPMLGASGAIAGVLGAYLLLHPKANVGILVVIIIIVRVVTVPAVIVLGIWFAMQLLDGAHARGAEGGVAYAAHVGGFLAGMALIPLFKRAGVPLFQGANSRPFAVTRARNSGHLPPPIG